MSLRWKAVRAASPLLRLLPPWYRVRAYARLAGRPFEHGALAGKVTQRVAPHDYLMTLDLSDWMERFAALNGIYYEIEATATLARLLRPGDIFVDVGGNMGFLSLTAAALVGQRGTVIYVEPNAELVGRFRETCRRNQLDIAVHQAALGAAPGGAALEVGDHHGTARLEEGRGVTVLTGGDLAVPDGPLCLVKIDVEGYEWQVLVGMAALLDRPDTAFLVELTDAWLRRTGGSAKQVFELMTERGYRAWRPRATRRGLVLAPIEVPADDYQYDVLFVRGAALTDRLGVA